MILLAHFTGNPNSRQAALCMEENGWLAELHTTVHWRYGNSVGRILPATVRNELQRRSFPVEVQDKVCSHPFREMMRLCCRNKRFRSISRLTDRFFSTDAVLQGFDKIVSRSLGHKDLTAVYCYEDAGLHIMKAAKERGLKTIYELPTPYWRFKQEIIRDEMSLQPDWGRTLRKAEDSIEKLERKDQELMLADMVIVPSKLVADSLRLAPAFPGSIHEVPYGTPTAEGFKISDMQSSQRDLLKVLFVGNLTQAKGLGYLAEAVQSLENEISLTVVGKRVGADTFASVESFLGRQHHIDGIPQSEVLEVMAQHEVLVLPTLYEGLSLVLLEAMSRGMTIITTPNSGIEGLITDGLEGFIVPIRDGSVIRDRLSMLFRDRSRLLQMRQAALVRSRELDWGAYRKRLGMILAETAK